MICRFADFSEYAHETIDLIGAPLHPQRWRGAKIPPKTPTGRPLDEDRLFKDRRARNEGQVEAVHSKVGTDSQVFFEPRSPPILIKSPYYPTTPWVAQVMYRWLAQGLAGQALQWHCALQMLWQSHARPGQRYPRSFPKLPSRTSPAPGSNISKVREDKKRYHAQ